MHPESYEGGKFKICLAKYCATYIDSAASCEEVASVISGITAGMEDMV